MSRFLHIVSPIAPCPTYCGSAIDIFTRIKEFHKKGVKVLLHYFDDKNCGCDTAGLDNCCAEINIYERKDAAECLSLQAPYFVNSRCNKELVETINKDGHPVLFEGIRGTGIINDINAEDRKICVRVHNEESVYNRELARCSSNPAKKTYYLAESVLAKKYLSALPPNCMYACISIQDKEYLEKFGFEDVRYIPAFPAWQKVTSETGIGNLCLFHGNLSIAENEKAALWLLCNVFNKVRVPFIIAGKDPPRSLQKAAGLCQNTCIVSNPCNTEMEDLVQKAHINILPAFSKNNTGTPLKLLHALYEGRHCVVTPALVEGTGLNEACHIGTNARALASIISQLYYRPFEAEEIELRKNLLYPTYCNEKNIDAFIDYLW